MSAIVVALVGPTAIGKSRIAMEIAPRYGGEIVSIDSMQVYRGMDIGTAKPSPEEMRRVPHHLIDLVEPGQQFSVAEFQSEARWAIDGILERGGMPLLVGGSGLYLRAALYDLEIPPPPKSMELRDKYVSRGDEEARRELFARLETVDPLSAASIGPNNLRRLIRALEVFESTGMAFSSFQRDYNDVPLRYPSLIVGLTTDRARLKTLIDKRVEEMMESGLVEEVERLAQGPGFSDTSRQALGYREVLDFLDNRASFEETIEKIKINTRRFAKRQMTWFRKDERVHWIELSADSLLNAADAATLVLDYIDKALTEGGK